MSWVCGRKATAEDYEKLDKRAAAFIKRHEVDCEFELSVNDGRAWGALEECLHYECDYNSYSPEHSYYMHLRRLWRAIFRRAVGDSTATGIAWEHIGHEGE